LSSTAREEGEEPMEFLMSMLAPADQLGKGASAEVGAAVGEYGMRLASATARRRPPAPRRGFRVEPTDDAGRTVDGPSPRPRS
jgi:hypothetical protein